MTANQLTHGSFKGDTEVPSPGVREVAVYLSRLTDLPFREAIHWKRLVATVRRDHAGTTPSGPDPLPGVDMRSRGDRDRGIDPDLHSLIFPTDREARPVRVYFGNEFCELRIPKRGEFEDSCTVVHEAGLPLTFVTPPATDKGMRTLFDRLTDLQRWSPESEVVVNDWGTLHLVNEEFTSLTPLLGRLMSKLLRDPRITPRCDDPGVSSEALGSLRKCSLNISAYRSLLTSYGGS